VWTALLLGAAAAPALARAHGTPVAFSIWGDFPPAVARCQRNIGRAAALCGLQAWRIRRDCALAELRGTPCNAMDAAAGIEAARLRAADRVSSSCAPSHAAMLQFLDLSEAQRDTVRFCREVDAAVVSVVLSPLANGADTACATATATATTKLLDLGLRSRQRLLGRVAGGPFTPPAKRMLVLDSSAEIARARAVLAADIADVCPANAFAALFGRDAADLLAAVATRSDCLAGETYAQDGIVCPAALCGNRMQERAEECDDGNIAGSDGCSADCRRE
jgi:cysteine-rich repeat protein